MLYELQGLPMALSRPGPRLFLWVAATGLLVLAVLLVVSRRRAIRRMDTVSALQRQLMDMHMHAADICQLVCTQGARLVRATTLIVQLRNPHGEVDHCRVVEHGQPVETGPLPEEILDYLDQVRRPVQLRFGARPAPFAPFPVGPKPRSGLYVPMLAGDTLFGLIALQSPRPRAFTSGDMRALALFAAQVATALYTTRLIHQERQRTMQLLTIAEVSRKVAAILDVQTLFADTVQFIQEALGYYHVCILTVTENGERITLQASSSPRMQERGIDLPLGKGIIGHAAQLGESVLANDVSHAEHYVADVGLDKTRSELAIPLKVEERILGVLDLQSDRVDAFDADDLPVLRVLADQVAVALEDSRIYAAQQEQAWVSTALLQVAETLAQRSTAEEIQTAIVRLATLLVGVERSLLFLWSAEQERYILEEGAGLPLDVLNPLRGTEVAPEQAPSLAAVHQRLGAHTGHADELWSHLPLDPAVSVEPGAATPDAAMLTLPLWASGQFLGALVAEDRTAEPMASAREAILVGLAGDGAMALENARLAASQREEAWVSTALLQVANVVVRAASGLDETLATIARLTPMLVGIEWCAVLLWDEEREAFYCAASEGRTPHQAARLAGQYLDPDSSPLLAGVVDGQDAVVGVCEWESATLQESVAPEVAQTPVTALPLKVQDRMLGALLAGHEHGCAGIPARRMSILAGIANQAALAIDTARLYQQSLRQERLQRELELARNIQQSFLPAHHPELPGWQIEVEWHAAGDVGGDFYDLVTLPNDRLGLAIADVSDKGVGAALYMALSRTVMRTVAREGYGPAETLRRVNGMLLDDASSGMGMFVSLFYGILDPASGRFTYARAGHNPPLYLPEGEAPRALDVPGIVLGVLPDPTLEEATLEMRPGDALLMYTDGVTEAIDAQGREFGEERLTTLVAQAGALSASELAQAVSDAVRRFVGERAPFDDLTLLALKREKRGKT